MARLATGIAGGFLAEGGRRIVRGDLPRARELLLTPANARRLAEQLATLRGAAMKLLDRVGVASVSGASFYRDPIGETILRFCFAKGDEVLHEAATRLRKGLL